MGAFRLSPEDRFGFLKTELDAHGMGITSLASLLEQCGFRTAVAGQDLRRAAERPLLPASARTLGAWLRGEGITVLGFSWRLDPASGARLFDELREALEALGSMKPQGGMLRALAFAGLPETCALVKERHPEIELLFPGEEEPEDCLEKLGIPLSLMPGGDRETLAYDRARLDFGRSLVKAGAYHAVRAVDRNDCPRFGQRGDSLLVRLEHGRARGLPPLMRAHAGPWLPDRREAVELFLSWARSLGRGGYLDVLSVGSSQLSQSRFGESWEGLADGGGVPIASPEEFEEVWKAARPMLVRSYSGSGRTLDLARILEERIDIAWHALSFWWFSALDGRGPLGVRDNLAEHIRAIRFIAETGKPLEPNVAHHFSFRGADDLSSVAAAYLAMRTARDCGVRDLVLQVMLETPRRTWGVQDLAKARVMLRLARELGADGGFRVHLQPRAGLDFFSADPETAKAQLAAATALMDDIEPEDGTSPPIIHVVSHSEARGLADPPVIEESVKITRHALESWRKERSAGRAPHMGRDSESRERTEALLAEVRSLVAAMEEAIPGLYGPDGLYLALASGFLALPGLAACREEFAQAADLSTAFLKGGMTAVGPDGRPLPLAERIRRAARHAAEKALSRNAQGEAI